MVLLIIILFILFIEGNLYIVLSNIFLIIECKLCVFVLCFIVLWVIVLSVFLWNLSLIFFIVNNVENCLVRVFFGLLRIWISVVLFSFVSVVIIGRWLINFGINLYLIRFFGFIFLNVLFKLWLFVDCLIWVLKLIFVFLWLCCLIILLRLVNVLL